MAYFGQEWPEGMARAEKLVQSQVQLADLIAPEGHTASVTSSIPHQVSSLRSLVWRIVAHYNLLDTDEGTRTRSCQAFGLLRRRCTGRIRIGRAGIAVCCCDTSKVQSRTQLLVDQLHLRGTWYTLVRHSSLSLAELYFSLMSLASRFSLLDNTKETVDCSICRKPSSHDLIGYSTPLPYHPLHVPEPSLDEFLPSASTISHSDFPICTTCASKSSNQSLRDLVTHVEGGTLDSTTVGIDDITSVAEALSKTDEMRRRRKGALSEEMDRTTF